jgi:formate/nitrite transporter FocA (FNT family)
MADRTPEEIWEEGLDEGQRRLERGWPALAATGFAGGADVMFGIVAVGVASAGLAATLPEPSAHIIGSLFFGLGFVFIIIGRAELFTENFLIPVGAVVDGRESTTRLVRMWGTTLVLNFVGLVLLGALVSLKGVLPAGSLHAVGVIANTLSDRSFLAALFSAIVAGVVMTVFTWIATASESAVGRMLAALLVGFLLAAPTLNHAVVGFGEMFLALLAGTTHAGWLDLVRNVSIAVLGNVIGGVGLVFTTRLAQVSSNPAPRAGGQKRQPPR